MRPKFALYTTKKTNRLAYIAGWIFEERLGYDLLITKDKQEFVDFKGFRLNYSNDQIENAPQITPSSLLFENRISEVDIAVNEVDGWPILFTNNRSSIGFDPLSACFYLISRFEEYLPYRKDEHGRFTTQSSIAGRYHSIDKPLADFYVAEVDRWFRSLYPDLPPIVTTTRLEVAIDVDQLFMFKSKGIARSVIGALSDLFRNRKSLVHRLDVLMGQKKDPLDIYASLILKCKSKGIRPIFFIQVGETSRFDLNNPIHLPEVIQRINELASDADIGLHPSYFSSDKHELLELEMERLSTTIGISIKSSRQHYLRHRMPGTIKKLEELGVRDEYSMGFPDKNGFRSGTSYPFRFYDLEKDEPANIHIHPLVFMDLLAIRNNDSFVAALEEMQSLYKSVCEFGGTFSTTWHPEALIGFDVDYPSMGLLDKLLGSLND